MKKSILAIIFFLVLPCLVFSQVSMNSFYSDWGSTEKYVRSNFESKNLTESNMGTSHFISCTDLFYKIPVKVDYIFDLKGNLVAKIISNQNNLKNKPELYKLFKDEAVGKFGTKFTSRSAKGSDTETWNSNKNFKVTIQSAGESIQYAIEKHSFTK